MSDARNDVHARKSASTFAEEFRSVLEAVPDPTPDLRRERKYGAASRPDLILLDLNLPRKDGREVLAEVKQDADLKRIPVVVLTSSKADDDVMKTYNLHATCYVTKPVGLEQFGAVVQAIEGFSLSTVKLPPDQSNG